MTGRTREAAVPRNTLKGPLRVAMFTVPAGFAIFIGGFAAIGLHERALGVALVVLALLTVGVACVMAYQFKTRAESFVRAAQQQRQANLERALRRDQDDPPIG